MRNMSLVTSFLVTKIAYLLANSRFYTPVKIARLLLTF